jgi:hypothetical protein
VEIGGLEVSEAGRVLGEAEAEVSYGVVLAAEAAAEAEEAIRALKHRQSVIFAKLILLFFCNL